MELPAQKAGGEDEELTDEYDVCLPIVPVEGTILVIDALDGGRTDRFAKDGSSSHLLLPKG
jgi:hypothetical protein